MSATTPAASGLRRRATTSTIVLQRCHWVRVHNLLRNMKSAYRAQAYGTLLELTVSSDLAATIVAMLPQGAVLPSVN